MCIQCMYNFVNYKPFHSLQATSWLKYKPFPATWMVGIIKFCMTVLLAQECQRQFNDDQARIMAHC